MYFLDSCALVKAFHREVGSEVISKLINEDTTLIFVAEISYPEFYSTVYKKLRNKEIKKESTVIQSCRRFEIAVHYINVIEINKSIISGAKNLIEKWGGKLSIRTLDALHLSCFLQLAKHNEVTFVTSDRKLYNIVKEMGYDVINPENDNQETIEGIQ